MTRPVSPFNTEARPLSGLRILDLTNVLSGPYCTYQMALLGAEVIKIENPRGGDLARQLGAEPDLNECLMGASFLAQNAGKKSVAINLKSEDGRQVFEKVVETADVLVENFRPGVMDRLGLGYQALRQINPRLIYCAITGFGQDGPLKDNPAYDQVVQGLSGVMSVTGDESKNAAPLRVGFPVCDTIGGLTGAFAVTSALLHRQRTGKGCYIDLSMLDSTLTTLGWAVSNYLITGQEPRPIGNQNMTAAPSGTFDTADGPINIAANKQEQFVTLCQLIGRPDLISDERFAARDARKQNRDQLNREINSALQSRSAADWETTLNRAGVPAGRVLSVPEILEHPQTKSRDLIQELDLPEMRNGKLRVTKTGFHMSDVEIGVSDAPPKLGAHTGELLTELGFSKATLDQLRKAGSIA